MSAPEFERVLSEHEHVRIDLTTPRQFTQHGGWNETCLCGEGLGDGGHPTPLEDRHRAHLAAALNAEVAPLIDALRRIVGLLDEEVEPDLDDYEHRAQSIYNLALAALAPADTTADEGGAR